MERDWEDYELRAGFYTELADDLERWEKAVRDAVTEYQFDATVADALSDLCRRCADLRRRCEEMAQDANRMMEKSS